MNRIKIMSLCMAAATLFAALPVSAVETKTAPPISFLEETSLTMDFNGDTVYGASDIRRLESFLHGGSKYEDVASGDRVLNAADLAILKRLVLSAERITSADSLPTGEIVSNALITGYFADAMPSNAVINNADDVAALYASIDEAGKYNPESMEYNQKMMLLEYDEEFFEDNSLVVAFSNCASREMRLLSLTDGKLDIASFYDYFPHINPRCYLKICTISKDLLSLCDYSEITATDCAESYSFEVNKAPEEDAKFSASSILYDSTKAYCDEIDQWMTESELNEFLTITLKSSNESVYAEAAEETVQKLLDTYDSEFFKSNKLLAVNCNLTEFYGIKAFYAPNGLVFEAKGVNELRTSGSICFIAVANDVYCEKASVFFSDLMMADKPVIYLYPEEETEVTVSLDVNGKITCVYPEFTDESASAWTVKASPDGTLTAPDGSQYSYLFWEAAVDTEWDMSEGYIVKGCDTLDFLRRILPETGLAAKEYNDFIVYWLPLMKNNEYNFITFQNEAYTDAARLELDPAPDSLLRVFMAYMPISSEEAAALESVVTEPELAPFERVGFTAVEWGGTEIKR